MVEQAEAWLDDEAAKVPLVRRLSTAPGIGPIRAAQTVATVITPHRFRTKRQFWSYCGLGIVTWISSEWEKDTGSWARDKAPLPRGLNRNHNPLLKSIFKGAANTVINQMPTNPLHQHYQQLVASGTKPNLARLTIARRIAAAVLAMWKHQEDYDPAKHKSTQTS